MTNHTKPAKKAPFFPADIPPTTVSYQLAADVQNNDGMSYAEYGLHDAAKHILKMYSKKRGYLPHGIPQTL